MSRALLDVNVLLALLDADHADHARAGAWFAAHADAGWASCAITANGFVRVISQPSYPSPISPARAIDLLATATGTEHHEHWACEPAITDPAVFNRTRLHGPRQVTDAYLLALAVAHEGRFATFDHAVPSSAVHGAAGQHLVVI